MNSYWQTDVPCIGFSNLPEQLHRKAIKKGFDFTIMVVGMFHISFSVLVLADDAEYCSRKNAEKSL